MRPHILVTNDDGITSPGIVALAVALREVGEVTVIAPDQNWSISGHQKALRRFLRADPYRFPHDIPAYVSNGAPADCVTLGMQGLLERVPDLVVSGINRGPNLGQDITYSGTVAAAFETAIFGYPAVAVSLDLRDPESPLEAFQDAAHVAVQVARTTLEHGLPRHSVLNVNVPAIPRSQWKGIKVTRLGVREYRDKLIASQDPSGRPYYWVSGEEPGGNFETVDTDIWAVHHGYVSVTPLRLDMTDDSLRERMREWKF